MWPARALRVPSAAPPDAASPLPAGLHSSGATALVVGTCGREGAAEHAANGARTPCSCMARQSLAALEEQPLPGHSRSMRRAWHHVHHPESAYQISQLS
jgi:hypothetical protein